MLVQLDARVHLVEVGVCGILTTGDHYGYEALAIQVVTQDMCHV